LCFQIAAALSGTLLGMNLDLTIQTIGEGLFRNNEIVMALQVHPTLGVRAEKPGQSQRGICRNRPFARHDFSNAALRHPNGLGKPVLGDVHGFEEILQQDFAGMHRGHLSFHLLTPLMIIGDFNIVCVTAPPGKTDPVLVIDPDAVLALSTAAKLFKAICPGNLQEAQACSSVHLGQFAQGHPLDVIRQARHKCPPEEPFCFLAAKRFDHS
jgi:hypothetical protein